MNGFEIIGMIATIILFILGLGVVVVKVNDLLDPDVIDDKED